MHSAVKDVQPRDLRALFSPSSVVLIGGSDRSMWSIGAAKRFNEYQYAGKVYAVNKTGASAHGYPGFTSCREIGEPVDIAYLMVPVEATLDALKDACAAGIRSAVVLTSGFSEAGEAGAAIQQQLVDYANDNGITLLGPNSVGFANVVQRKITTLVPARLPILPGSIGLISQSGAVLGEVTKFAHQQGIGLSFIAATGNEAQVDLSDIVSYMVDQDDIKVIAVFAEAIRHPARLLAAAARARQGRKPIVILKVGKSEITAKVAQAHTGSLVGDDKVFDAACIQAGIIRVGSIEELMLTAALLEKTGPLEKPGIAVVSISGGACGMFGDLSEQHGVTLPEFAPDTVAALRDVLPDLATTLNPLDITGAAIRKTEIWENVIRVVARDPSVGLTVVITPLPSIEAEVPSLVEQVGSIGRGLADSPVPGVVLVQSVQPSTTIMREFATQHGLPGISYGIAYSVRALGKIAWWSALLRRQPAPAATVAAVAAAGGQTRPRSEPEVLAYLAGSGVPVIPGIVATSTQQAVDHAARLACPVVLKIASPDIAHKTEVGGVKLNVQGDAQVAQTYRDIDERVRAACPSAQIDGIIVAPMRVNGTELFVGTARDPQWGPVIVVGVGGIWVEALADTAVRPLPVTPADVVDMLRSLRAVKILQGYRGAAPVDFDAVAEVVVRIGNAALALGPELVSLEVNPLLVTEGRVEALDGLTVWDDEAGGAA